MGEPLYNSRLSPLALAELWAGKKIYTTWSEIQDAKGLCPTDYEGVLRDEKGESMWLPEFEALGFAFFREYDCEFDEMTLVAQYDGFILDEMENGIMYNPYIQVSLEDGCVQVFSREEFATDPRFSRRIP